MSEIIDVSATAVQDDRSGWQAEDQIAVEYLEACKEAVASDTAFANFKSNPKYKTILEHVLKDQGQAYLCKVHNQRQAQNDLPRAACEAGFPRISS